ncbi:MAG: hypothetical protein JWM71_2506, partial [Solirubrobacteraceae bacterium]|nr:hypothetical protein [Solirubrobacteraceae bacterium]
MRRACIGVAAAALLVLAGCGSSGGSSTVTVDRTVTVVDSGSGTSTSSSAAASSSDGPVKGFDTQAIYAKDGPGVVTVVSLYSGSDALTGRGAEGSGFVIDGNGEIATNAHVVTVGSGSSIHKVAQVFIRFPDRNQVEAKIVGFDPNEDVALLKVDPSGLKLEPLKMGSSGALQVGSPVAAIGSPFGEEGSMSTGIVSATDRTID